MAKLAYITFRSTRIDEMKSFYQALLGCSFVQEKHGNGPVHYSTDVDGVVLEFYPAEPDNVTTNVRLGFAVPHLDKTLSAIERVRILKPKTMIRGGAYAIVMDPVGNTVELRENLD